MVLYGAVIVNFPFLDGEVPRRPYYAVYISQLIPFARASSYFMVTSIVVTSSYHQAP